MVSFPAEILVGLYLGLLVGTIPGLVSWGIGFGFNRITGATIPVVGVLLLALSLAGINGALLAAAGESVAANADTTRIGAAALVVGILSLYAHSTGETMATVLSERSPSPGTQPSESNTEKSDDGVGERAERTEQHLRTEYDVSDVSVTIDEDGRATVAAAPSLPGLSKQMDDGRHAVSVTGLIPTGLARGDEVTVITPNTQVPGTVVSARTASQGDISAESPSTRDGDRTPDGTQLPTTDGGRGRLTVAVARTDVKPLLRAPEVKIVVESRDTPREFEAVSMLRRADHHVRQRVVEAGSRLDGLRLGDTDLRSTDGVDIFAVKQGDTWQVAPDGTTTLAAGDELFAVGERDALDKFGGQAP